MSTIHECIISISFFIYIQWIPGNSSIPAKKLANTATKEATTIATNIILPLFLYLFPAIYRLLMRRFATVHQLTNGSHKYTHNEKLSGIQNKSLIERAAYC